MSNLTSFELGLLVIVVLTFACLGMGAIVALVANVILNGNDKAKRNKALKEEGNIPTLFDAIEQEEETVKLPLTENQSILFHKDERGIWTSYLQMGDLKTQVDIEPMTTLKETMMKTFLHLEVRPPKELLDV